MNRFFFIFFTFFLLRSALATSSGDGGYAGAFLRMGFEARTKALGDAFTGVPEGAVAGVYNPATLPNLATRQAILSTSFLPLDRHLNYIGFALPIRPKAKEGSPGQPLHAGIAVGWINAGVDNIDGRDRSGNRTGSLSNAENAFFMSFALKPSSYFSIGLSGKILYNRIPDIAEENSALTSSGFGIDIGAYSNPLPGLMLGLVLRDNMSKYSWNTDKVYERGTSTIYKFPKIVRAGMAYRIPQQWLLLVADLETSDVQNPRYHFGAEFEYKQIGALRLGLDHDTPTFGLGLYAKLFGKQSVFNYAFMPGLEALAPDHVVSWTFDF
ncbi:hypothetical protein EH223_19770 [candidate division KSB1 bacterium]|nr:hypothetical protein [candidate division KSB1 bacterium]RQW00182.1 MAG: hypothetical protein EH223_19770 [candidate division KSB1 bacterium]